MSNEIARVSRKPLEYRQDEVGLVMERWRASDSCSLIGVGSVGKSNLLQHLADPKVQEFYMDVTKVQKFKAIIIDPNLLGPLPDENTPNSEQLRAWAGYELMMHRLFLSFYPLVDSLGEEEARQFYDTYLALQDGNNPLYAYMGLRYFELGLEFFMRRGVHIVFMFDEFEEMLRRLPVKFFQTLRGLRDSNKRQLSYLTFTRSPILDVAEKYGIAELDIEPFAELFTDSVIYVGPFNDRDTRRLVQEFVKRNNRQHSEYALDFLIWATGGYAGLTRAGFRALESLGQLDANTVMTTGEKIVNQLASRRAVRSECRTIWMSLSNPEQEMLREFTNPRPSINVNVYEVKQTYALLEQKRLIRVHENQVIIEPPVFRSFVMNNPDAEI